MTRKKLGVIGRKPGKVLRLSSSKAHDAFGLDGLPTY